MLAGELANGSTPEGLMRLPRCYAVVRTAINGVPRRPFVVKTEPSPKSTWNHASKKTITQVLEPAVSSDCDGTSTGVNNPKGYGFRHSPRQYGHSDHICDQGGKPEEACEVGCFLLVASRHTAASFHASKEAFDLVAMFVDFPVVTFLDLSPWVGLDANLRFELLAPFANRIGVVSRVSNQGANLTRLKVFQQPFALRSITTLPCGENEGEQPSAFARGSVNLCCQSATAASEASTIVGIAFFSPGFRCPVEAV